MKVIVFQRRNLDPTTKSGEMKKKKKKKLGLQNKPTIFEQEMIVDAYQSYDQTFH